MNNWKNDKRNLTKKTQAIVDRLGKSFFKEETIQWLGKRRPKKRIDLIERIFEKGQEASKSEKYVLIAGLYEILTHHRILPIAPFKQGMVRIPFDVLLTQIESVLEEKYAYFDELIKHTLTEKPAETKPEVEPDHSDENKAYIKKERSFWVFGFNGETAKVKFQPDKELKGLALIEFLLIHPNKEYTPLKLLQETGQREKGETEPEKIYTDNGIGQITKAIEGLKGRAELTTEREEKERLEQEIEDAKAILYKTRNCKGKSRKFSEKYTKSVSRNIETVLKKIAPQNVELYNHLDTFLKAGEKCYYKPDTEIFWEISLKTA